MSTTRAEKAVGSAARTFLLLGCVSAMVAVAFGAFGAHALEGRLSPERIATWETAAQYHLDDNLKITFEANPCTRRNKSARLFKKYGSTYLIEGKKRKKYTSKLNRWHVFVGASREIDSATEIITSKL